MWCTNCQQDAPAIAHGDLARCAQCGRFLKRRADEHLAASTSSVTVGETEPVFAASSVVNFAEPDDDWTLQERVRHLQRRLRLDQAPMIPRIFHDDIPAPTAEFNPGRILTAKPATSAERASAVFAWILIALGSMAFIGGASLFAWWFLDGSKDLWYFAVPIALAGQFGLLLGLVLQLNRLRQINRRITESLHHVDRQLCQLNDHSAVPRQYQTQFPLRAR